MVEKFMYLGCEVRKDEDIKNVVDIRSGKADSEFQNMKESGMRMVCPFVQS